MKITSNNKMAQANAKIVGNQKYSQWNFVLFVLCDFFPIETEHFINADRFQKDSIRFDSIYGWKFNFQHFESNVSGEKRKRKIKRKICVKLKVFHPSNTSKSKSKSKSIKRFFEMHVLWFSVCVPSLSFSGDTQTQSWWME